MFCFKSSLIRQLYNFTTDFNRVLLQLAGTDIENSLFKYRVSYRHLTFMIETFELLMNTLCHVLYENGNVLETVQYGDVPADCGSTAY